MADVTTQHPQYAGAQSRWQRCRDAYDGGDAVKARGVAYLPRLDAMTDAEYAAYKLRADFYGATGRTVDGLAGAVLRKAPSTVLPNDDLRTHLADVTSSGVPFEAFAKELVEEVLTVGRSGVLVDLPVDAGVDGRPYWVSYAAEQIINWRTETRNGRTVLLLVVLKECELRATADDPFVIEEIERYRVLQLVTGAGGGDEYQVTLYTQAADSKSWIAGAPIVPKRRGASLGFIPFVFVGPAGITPAVEKPPCLDLVDLNLSHYRSSADLERARFYVASPTPYICGFDGTGTTVPTAQSTVDGQPVPRRPREYRIGSSVAWTFQSPETKVGILEFTGQGLTELRNALKDKQELMAVLGARLLEHQKADAEAAATVKLRHAGDESVLKKLTTSVDQALTQILRWHVWWAGIEAPDEQVSAALNADVFSIVVSPDLVAKLLLAVQAGEMSSETFYWNLQRGEYARPGVTFEEERKAIEAGESGAEAPPPAPADSARAGQPPPGAPVDDPDDVDDDQA